MPQMPHRDFKHQTSRPFMSLYSSLLLREGTQLFVNTIPTHYTMYRTGKRSMWYRPNYNVFDDSKSAQLLKLLLCYMKTFCGTRNYWRDWRAVPDETQCDAIQYVFFFFCKIWKGYYRSFLQSREKSIAWSLIVRNGSASIFSEGYFSVVWVVWFFFLFLFEKNLKYSSFKCFCLSAMLTQFTAYLRML